jgi:hypothetical protein
VHTLGSQRNNSSPCDRSIAESRRVRPRRSRARSATLQSWSRTSWGTGAASVGMVDDARFCSTMSRGGTRAIAPSVCHGNCPRPNRPVSVHKSSSTDSPARRSSDSDRDHLRSGSESMLTLGWPATMAMPRDVASSIASNNQVATMRR